MAFDADKCQNSTIGDMRASVPAPLSNSGELIVRPLRTSLLFLPVAWLAAWPTLSVSTRPLPEARALDEGRKLTLFLVAVRLHGVSADVAGWTQACMNWGGKRSRDWRLQLGKRGASSHKRTDREYQIEGERAFGD